MFPSSWGALDGPGYFPVLRKASKMTTDTSERGLERLICAALTGSPCDPGPGPSDIARERQWLADTVFSITYG